MCFLKNLDFIRYFLHMVLPSLINSGILWANWSILCFIRFIHFELWKAVILESNVLVDVLCYCTIGVFIIWNVNWPLNLLTIILHVSHIHWWLRNRFHIRIRVNTIFVWLLILWYVILSFPIWSVGVYHSYVVIIVFHFKIPFIWCFGFHVTPFTSAFHATSSPIVGDAALRLHKLNNGIIDRIINRSVIYIMCCRISCLKPHVTLSAYRLHGLSHCFWNRRLQHWL